VPAVCGRFLAMDCSTAARVRRRTGSIKALLS
jgi:hypothetical protein